MKIGVFDSGIGGVTVLTELRKSLPGADYVYIGDTAHLPYGTKSAAQIGRLSAACAHTLKSKNVDAVVVACNTVSAWALEPIREVMGDIPVFGVVEPGVEAALSALKRDFDAGAPVMVLATPATVRSGSYGKILRQALADSGIKATVIEQACPLLVPMIEEGWIDHPILHQTIQEYVQKHLSQHPRGVALLGCTHYPWIQEAFEKALSGWRVVNSAQAIVEFLVRKGISKGILTGNSESSAGQRGLVEWIFTDVEAVPSFARRLIQNQ